MPYDRSADDHRCLTFDSAALTADLEIAGSPEALVVLSADEPDFPLHVALCDVAPDGLSTLVCQGWGRASHLAGEPLRPGEVYALPVPLYATYSRIARGQRLRLVISGADFPLLWPAARNPALTVWYGPAHGTILRLPVALEPASGPAPQFLPVDAPAPSGMQRGHNRLLRDMTGETATFDQRSESLQTLADGSLLHIAEHSLSTVARSRPADTVLRANLEARLDRPADTVVATVASIQTSDAFHIEAQITVAGKSFYRRTWDLSLDSDKGD